MLMKLFSFTKIEKLPKTIEDKINLFLEDGKSFKFAAQSESIKNGKFYLSVYYENKKSKIRAKVFKDTHVKNLEDRVNSFLKDGHTMKWSSQSSSTSNIYLVIFYEPGKVNENQEENQD